MAIGAVEESGCPLDLDAGDADTSPTSLGLPQKERRESCSRRRRPVDTCPECGSPLCGDCITGDEG
jgi:hypothetical protein